MIRIKPPSDGRAYDEAMHQERRQNRHLLSPGAAVGVTEPMIHELVHAFYAKVRRDPQLGPIFDAAIGDHWDKHLAKLCDFWSSVLLTTGRYKGAPMPVHAALPRIEGGHFVRWLEIFTETAGELWPSEAAALVVARANMIARSLQYGIAASRGEMIDDLSRS
ncbi:group III truncated hemoglobin [Caulobacter segnis]|uniref:group III truncated hemoglobin n=1 Tax=Caulobacter segnis TaxID=88688 RepID=UPI002410A56F|nr:group III truncated hemoglobin [Caulobacter segnis]MDG2521311.1 group III truncated hemoglobin [Caulobacter segnis]